MKRKLVDILTEKGTPRPVAMKAVDLASSSYYYQPVSKRKGRPLDAGLVAAINNVRQGHGEVYGYRKVTEAIRAEGIKVNGKKVLCHLRSLGLTQPRKVKGLRWTRPALVKPGSANTYWEADFTYVWTGDSNAYLCYVWTGDSNAYLCAIIDAWNRDIVGDVFSDRCRALEAAQALEKAVLYRFGGKVPEGYHLTLRVDRGSQFRAHRLPTS